MDRFARELQKKPEEVTRMKSFMSYDMGEPRCKTIIPCPDPNTNIMYVLGGAKDLYSVYLDGCNTLRNFTFPISSGEITCMKLI